MISMELQDIPQTWLILGLGVGLVVLRVYGIDTWTTAALSSLTGYILGRHIAQNNLCTSTAIAPAVVPNPVSGKK